MFETTFCSSPWFHVRLTYDGSYEACRWGKNPERQHKFQHSTIMQYYNSDQMNTLRQQLLTGESPALCASCYYEESFGKLNGRKRQLIKSAIDTNNFALTLRSSPHYKNFNYSFDHDGKANLAPVDLQIELGNTCNSACIMCAPEASSRLEKDYHVLHKINAKLFDKPDVSTAWTRDKSLVDRLVNELLDIPNIRYIHFLGGETLYEESFYTICEALVKQDRAKDIIVGTTTNGTIFNDRVQNLIDNFKQFHLGISIESVTGLNDYIRWPSKVANILSNIHKFLNLRKTSSGLYVSLRITPTVFSIYEIDQLFEFMIANNVIAESCNILYNPACLRVELLPEDIRTEIKQKLAKLVHDYNLNYNEIVNVRRADQIDQVVANVILDYYKFICNYQIPTNADQSRLDLVNFVKSFEKIRGNSIVNHLPRYEKFLRHYGY